MKIKTLKKINKKGFTILELVVSIAIFAIMTALMLAKYGNFNQGVLLTNLAYDIALTIRNAQSYGLNVKSAPTTDSSYSNDFNSPYGVHLEKGSLLNKTIIFYADNDNDGTYDSGEEISKTTIKNGSYISNLCVGDGSSCSGVEPSILDIVFKRPDPNAIMSANGMTHSYAEITVSATDGTTKKVIVRSNGQISVSN